MIGMASFKQRLNVPRVSLLALSILFALCMLLPRIALAATAEPTYTCGSYGGNNYGECDTPASSVSSTSNNTPTGTSGNNSTATLAATGADAATTSTDTTKTTPVTTSSGKPIETAKGKATNWLLFTISLLLFLLGLLFFFLILAKRRKQADEPKH